MRQPLDLEQKIRELEENIRILQMENDQLAERAEDTLLLGLIAEEIGTAEEIGQVLESGLERISVLKDIPFCACCSLTGNTAVIVKSYLSFSNEDMSNQAIILPKAMMRKLAAGGCLLFGDEFRRERFSIEMQTGSFVPLSVICVPFKSRYIGASIFIFADDQSEDRLLSVIDMLHRVTEMIVARMDNILLFQELQELNRGLDHKVEERTRELRESENRFRQFFEDEPAYCYMISLDGLILDVNRAALEVLACRKEVLVGKPLQTIYAPESLPKMRENFEKWKATGKLSDVEMVILSKSGEKHTVLLNADVVKDTKGNPIHSISVQRDITERKQAEEEIRKLNQELEQRVADRTAQLEAANKELEAFTYSVSHDLRAPLRHIDGFIEMLQTKTKTTLDDQARHYMEVIAESARKMGTLIDNLLSFSRMGRNEIFKSQVDLGKLVQDVIQEFEPDAEGRDVRWKLSPLPWVTGDQAMLRIVLVNLIANALKFTRSCQPTEIEIGCLPDQGNEIIVFIRDNGVGFDMAYADKLFGVFQRLHRPDEFEGTGIGLANVRRIINRHGGRTWAEGKVNQGATFYFSLSR